MNTDIKTGASNGKQLTHGHVVASIDRADGNRRALGLLPYTGELLSTEEAARLGIPTPFILCDCGNRMYQGERINTPYGPYCSEECIHLHLCMDYALAGFVTEEDVANPSHPIYHWMCHHRNHANQQ